MVLVGRSAQAVPSVLMVPVFVLQGKPRAAVNVWIPKPITHTVGHVAKRAHKVKSAKLANAKSLARLAKRSATSCVCL